MAQTSKDPQVVIGEDWVRPVDQEMRARRSRRGLLSLRRSPLARKIVLFNLLALVVLVAGVFYLNPVRDSLVSQRAQSLTAEARLIADVFEAQLPSGGPVDLAARDGVDADATLDVLTLDEGVEVYVYDLSAQEVANSEGRPKYDGVDTEKPAGSTVLSDALTRAWTWISTAVSGPQDTDREAATEAARADVTAAALEQASPVSVLADGAGPATFVVGAPIERRGQVVGAISVVTADREIETALRIQREQILRIFLVAVLVSIGLSLVLANTIANPLSDLSAAAELGRDRNARKMSPERVRIPDLTARPDEIGRLSGALRGMVVALYDRIDANEQFAADVSHEIKNPLASLRSAVSTLRVAKKDGDRSKLLDVIDHDVGRLDRLVSDISNASRLDSELVREDEARFDLLTMLRHLIDFHGANAAEKGIDFVSDLPGDAIEIDGLEGRLAQVFVNLITNAMSFCEDGDAVRIWARRRDNRVLVVVEDTGPGIPEQALNKVFNRFYSERPERQFGNHSGLGLAISKQIVEAHGGVIWAENIRPTDADLTSDPLGARFVVGLPV